VGAQGTAEEGGQGAQIQALDSHKVPFICYFAMSTLLSIKQAGEKKGAKATHGFGAPAAGPQVGSIVTIISGVTGAPAGHSSAGLSVGMKLEIAQVMHWQNAWYATCTRWTTLWFPLSSTDWHDGGDVAAAHSGGGTVASGFGAAATSNPTNPVEWRKRIDEAVKSAMLPEVKSSLSSLQRYLEDRRAGVAELRGHGARDDEASFRSLMSLALRLMIRKHKEPLINEILQLDTSSARQSLPEVKIDRFQALKDAGDKLQHTVIAQIQRQLGLNAIAMRGDRWWKVSFVGMQVDKNEAAQDDDPEFENFAKANRMQKCPRCSAWVQKTDGCDAMHCLCNQVFCYICAGVLKEGTGIKQCKCPGAVSSL